MVEDRRADRPPLPFWRKPNWMVPLIVAALNSLAMFGVAHVTASRVNPLRSSTGRGDDQVLSGRAVRTEDTWDLQAGGFEVDRLSMDCAEATNVTVAVRTDATTVTAVMCPDPLP